MIKPGVIFLAARTGMPIIPLGFAYQDCWRVGSWDRFAIPKPWRGAWCVAAKPITVPRETDREGMREYGRMLQQTMDSAQAEAEGIASGRRSRAPLMSHYQAQSAEVAPAEMFGRAGVS